MNATQARGPTGRGRSSQLPRLLLVVMLCGVALFLQSRASISSIHRNERRGIELLLRNLDSSSDARRGFENLEDFVDAVDSDPPVSRDASGTPPTVSVLIPLRSTSDFHPAHMKLCEQRSFCQILLLAVHETGVQVVSWLASNKTQGIEVYYPRKRARSPGFAGFINMGLEYLAKQNNLGSYVLILHPKYTNLPAKMVEQMMSQVFETDADVIGCRTTTKMESGLEVLVDRGYDVSLDYRRHVNRTKFVLSMAKQWAGFPVAWKGLHGPSPALAVDPHCFLAKKATLSLPCPTGSRFQKGLCVGTETMHDDEFALYMTADQEAALLRRIASLAEKKLDQLSVPQIAGGSGSLKRAVREAYEFVSLAAQRWQSHRASNPAILNDDPQLAPELQEIVDGLVAEIETLSVAAALSRLSEEGRHSLSGSARAVEVTSVKEIGWDLAFRVQMGQQQNPKHRGPTESVRKHTPPHVVLGTTQSPRVWVSNVSLQLPLFTAFPELEPKLIGPAVNASAGEEQSSVSLPLSSTFVKSWGPSLESRITHLMSDTKTGFKGPIRAVWDLVCNTCKDDSLFIAQVLSTLLPMTLSAVRQHPSCFCNSLPIGVKDEIARVYTPASPSQLLTDPDFFPSVFPRGSPLYWFSQTNVTLPRLLGSQRIPVLLVCFTTTPWGRLTAEEVRAAWGCNEFWVQSQFVKNILVRHGLLARRVHVISAGFPTFGMQFEQLEKKFVRRAEYTFPLQPEKFARTDWKQWCSFGEAGGADGKVASVTASNRSTFTFLSDISNELSDWVGILEAYLAAFERKDETTLMLLKRAEASDADLSGLETALKAIAQRLGKAPARVCLLEGHQNDIELSALYRGANAFIAVEPFDAPVWSALRASWHGLPIIASHWGSVTEYFSTNSAFLVPLEYVGAAEATTGLADDLESEEHRRLVRPSLNAFSKILSVVNRNRGYARRVGHSARTLLLKRFAREPLRGFLLERLQRAQ